MSLYRSFFLVLFPYILSKGISISEYIYKETVGVQNAKHASSISNSIYENAITNAQNIQTTFKAVQQVKQMLGEVTDTLNDLTEALEEGDPKTRRLLGIEECDTNAKCKGPDRLCECDDPTRTCDCLPNWLFISKQPNAGCDEFDSDGDGDIDVCEDRSPPSVLFGNSELFRCDETNVTKLCYSGKVFQKHEYARDFLEYQVKVTDDCQPIKNLGIDINHTSGTVCHETLYGEYWLVFLIIGWVALCD